MIYNPERKTEEQLLRGLGLGPAPNARTTEAERGIPGRGRAAGTKMELTSMDAVCCAQGENHAGSPWLDR